MRTGWSVDSALKKPAIVIAALLLAQVAGARGDRIANTAADDKTATADPGREATSAGRKATSAGRKATSAGRKATSAGRKATNDKPAAKKPDKPRAEPRGDLSAFTNDPLLGRADQINGIETKGYVAFTFDDGPNPHTTPAVIDACEKYSIPAAFFIVSQRLLGKHGEKSREVLARQVQRGFLVESHSFSHPNLKGANAKTLSREIDEAVRILSKESGRQIGMFRAPFGALDGTGRGWLKKRGLTEVFWSVDTLDWKAKNAERLRKKVFDMIVKQEGGVVLMHDVKPITAKIVADVFDDLEAENCKRLASKTKEPIWPVSIHYFLRDKKTHRTIPDDAKKVTEAYKAALPARCARRPPPPPEPEKPAAKPAKSEKPAKK